MTDYGSSPDLLDVWQVGWAFLRSQPWPDLPDSQQVGLVPEAFAQPKMSGCRGWRSYWQSISQGYPSGLRPDRRGQVALWSGSGGIFFRLIVPAVGLHNQKCFIVEGS